MHFSGRDATLLMLQWALWKHLAPLLIMDGERFQQMSERLAAALYADGVRMPLDDDVNETPTQLRADLQNIVDTIGPTPLSREVMRDRVCKTARKLYELGWRKFSDVAA